MHQLSRYEAINRSSCEGCELGNSWNMCWVSRRGGVHRKDGSEQSIVIVKRVHRQTWLPRENRLCTHCSNRVVEDEFLFLTECNKYNNIRGTYFSRTEDICSGFLKMKREDKITPRGNRWIHRPNILVSTLLPHIEREYHITVNNE